jgi:beta-glucuronidase
MSYQSKHYPLYPQRSVHLLDGMWEMTFLGDVEPADVDVAALTFDRRLAVPGVWDTQPGLEGQRGLVALTRTIEVTPGTAGRMVCGGLGLWGQLWVDGQCLSDHHLPYAQWIADIPASERRKRQVTLLLDNRIEPERGLLFDDYMDWYGHGGIFRSITWHELAPVSIHRAQCRLQDRATADVEIDIQLLGDDLPAQVELLAQWDEGEQQHVQLPISDGTAIWSTTVPAAQLWSPENPHLHILHLQLADGSDGITERIGLRTIEARDQQLWLNGEVVRLEGVNRHEAQVVTGPILSLAEKYHDILLLKDLGCNFVRGSHYQQDQEFLDLCDEHGLLVWEEGTGWQPRDRHFTNPRFVELQEQSLAAMIDASFNHPSVIMWGFLNEGDTFMESSRPVYERLSAFLRSANDGRVITYACNHPFKCWNLDLADLISINMYPGWYPQWEDRETATMHHPFELIERNMDKVLAHLEEKGHTDQPIMVSEIGAGAIYGWRDQFAARWTEQYQANFMKALFDYLRKTPRWQGLAIWHFSDARTYQDGHALGRPRAFNNKGLLDEYRRPKEAYGTVKQGFADGVIATIA